MLKFIDELGEDYASRFSYKLFDVSVKENWESFAEELNANGTKVDILINNAGILPKFKRFDRYSYEEIERVAEWCKAQNIKGYILYYESEDDIKENYDPYITLDRCYTCSVTDGELSYDYIIYIDANGDPQQYYYEPQE